MIRAGMVVRAIVDTGEVKAGETFKVIARYPGNNGTVILITPVKADNLWDSVEADATCFQAVDTGLPS
jgi:hypothetical protein